MPPMLLVTNRTVTSDVDDCCKRVSQLAPVPESQEERSFSAGEGPRRTEEGEEVEYHAGEEVIAGGDGSPKD